MNCPHCGKTIGTLFPDATAVAAAPGMPIWFTANAADVAPPIIYSYPQINAAAGVPCVLTETIMVGG